MQSVQITPLAVIVEAVVQEVARVVVVVVVVTAKAALAYFDYNKRQIVELSGIVMVLF